MIPDPSTDDLWTDGRRPRLRSAATLGLLSVGAAALVAAGDLVPPPPPDPTRLLGWFETHDPAMAVAGALRVVSLGAVGYLAALVVLGSVLRTRRHGPVMASRLPPWLGRRVLEQALGMGVVTGVGLSLGPAGAMAGTGPAEIGPAPTDQAAEQPPDTILMVPVEAERAPTTTSSTRLPRVDPIPTSTTLLTTTTTVERRAVPAEPTATMTSIDGSGAPDTRSAPEERPAEPTPTAPEATGSTTASPAPAVTADETTWRVELGDHLWAIAAETLTDQGVPADDPSVLDYWTRLLDANRERLVDPDNPDLLFPGQVLVLPALSAG